MTEVTLSRRLLLETRESTSDGAGGFAVSWRALGTVWADVQARSGREELHAGKPTSRVTSRIVVRAAPVGAASRPRPDQRFREGARIFNILAVAEYDPRGRYLAIDAEEGVLP